jgi:hypothetical protein
MAVLWPWQARLERGHGFDVLGLVRLIGATIVLVRVRVHVHVHVCK